MSLPQPPVYTAPAAAPKNTMATVALVLGLVAFVLAVIPGPSFVAGFVGITAAILGSITFFSRKPRAVRALIGALVGGLAALIAVIVSLVVIVGASSSATPAALTPITSSSAAPAPEPSKVEEEPVESPSATAEEEPVVEPSEEPVAEPEPSKTAEAPEATDLDTYKKISARGLALVVKDPDAKMFEQYILYGNITQFDSATGNCQFLVSVSNEQKENSYEYDQNSIAGNGEETDCDLFSDIVEGDNVKMWVIVAGSFSYDTQIGGNTTVPSFLVTKIKRLPATEY